MGLKSWRKSRSFWGSFITIVSGAMILWVPLNLYLSTFLPGSIAIIGLLFGGLIILTGLLAMFFPNSSKILGIMTIFFSILSVIGALGGFLVGTVMGIIGGSLLIAWRPAEIIEPKHSRLEMTERPARIG
jgi:MFS family permease